MTRHLNIFSLAFTLIVFASFLNHIWDPDFFWHLRNGQWIVNHFSLPEHDFAIFPSENPLRVSFILKSYWITQVIYYGIFLLFGYQGFAVLKAVIFTLLFLVIMKLLKEKSITPFLILLMLLPIFSGLLAFRGDRPQMFTFLGFTILITLLETRRWQLLPIVMLVWANMHGGYIIGIATILFYIMCELWSSYHAEKYNKNLFFWGTLAILLSFVNPNFYKVIPIMFQIQGSNFMDTTIEYSSPIWLAITYRDYYFSYFIILLSAPILMFIRWKRTALVHKCIFLFLAAISLMHARYIPFLLIFGGIIISYSANALIGKWTNKKPLLALPLLALAVFFILDTKKGNALSVGIAENKFPVKAVNMMQEVQPKGNIFCDNYWGGYILWTLPGYTVFSDTRALSVDNFLLTVDVLNGMPGWEKVLADNSLDIVVTSMLSPTIGNLYLLPQYLLNSSEWSLVYSDHISLIFIRKTKANRAIIENHRVNRTHFFEHALSQALFFTETYPHTPFHWSILGFVYSYSGDYGKAIEAYQKAILLDPTDEKSKNDLEMIRSLIQR